MRTGRCSEVPLSVVSSILGLRVHRADRRFLDAAGRTSIFGFPRCGWSCRNIQSRRARFLFACEVDRRLNCEKWNFPPMPLELPVTKTPAEFDKTMDRWGKQDPGEVWKSYVRDAAPEQWSLVFKIYLSARNWRFHMNKQEDFTCSFCRVYKPENALFRLSGGDARICSRCASFAKEIADEQAAPSGQAGCSFCGGAEGRSKQVAVGPGVIICRECATRASDFFVDDDPTSPAARGGRCQRLLARVRSWMFGRGSARTASSGA